jgi:hypothetical protein
MYVATCFHIKIDQVFTDTSYGVHRRASSHFLLVQIEAKYFGCPAMPHSLWVATWQAQEANPKVPPLLQLVGGSSHGAFFTLAEALEYFRRLFARLGLRVAYLALHFSADGRLDWHVSAPNGDKGIPHFRSAEELRRRVRLAVVAETNRLNRARLLRETNTIGNYRTDKYGRVYFLEHGPLTQEPDRHAKSPALPPLPAPDALLLTSPATTEPAVEPTGAYLDLPAAPPALPAPLPATPKNTAKNTTPPPSMPPPGPAFAAPSGGADDEDDEKAKAKRRHAAEERDADLRRRALAQAAKPAAQLDLFFDFFPEPDGPPLKPTATRSGPPLPEPAPTRAPASRSVDQTLEFNFAEPSEGPTPPPTESWEAISARLLQRYAALADGPPKALADLQEEATALCARATPAAATDPAAAEVRHTSLAVADLAAERCRELESPTREAEPEVEAP